MKSRDPKSKIVSLDDLANIAAKDREAGKKVVLCHGVFDLLHMGHVRHLQAALAEGDVLAVTITTESHVNKGPGRPVFNDEMRAEMLAALEQVDWIAVSPYPSAEKIIDSIKPSIYVKGSDYANPEDDITNKIVAERDAVERHGGKIVFTNDITFSSSSLINQHLDVFDPELRDYLSGARAHGMEEKIAKALNDVKDLNVLVVGDAIIDEYQYVNAMGKSAKEHMIATRFISREQFAGGVFAAANHIASICNKVDILTVLGSDDSQEDFIRSQLCENVELIPFMRPNTPTTRKCRFVDGGYMRKLFETYYFDDTPIQPEVRDPLIDYISRKARDYDLVVVTDFGHGMLDQESIAALSNHSKFLCVNTQTNSANHGYNMVTRYPKADFICIDAPEAQLAAQDRFSRVEDILTQTLAKRIDCQRFIITHGKMGCVVFDKQDSLVRIPAFTKTVVDTVGAGDAFFSIAAPLAAVGTPMEVAAFAGNAAGAIKVGIVGHRKSVEKIPLVKYVTTLLK